MPWVLLIAALGGAVPTFSKMSLEIFPPFTFIFLRFISAALFLIPFVLKQKVKINKKDILPIVFVSIFATGNVVFFAFGVRETSATVSQLLYAAVPIIASILSVIILKATISKIKIVGVLLGFVGVLTIVFGSSNGVGMNFGSVRGNILVLFAVISYSICTVLSKRIQDKASPLAITSMMVLTTIIIQTLLIPLEANQYQSVIENITLSSILGIIYVGVIGTAIYFLLYQKVIENANPLFASMIFYLQPIFTYAWSFFLLGERITFKIVIGSIVVLVGAGLVMMKKFGTDVEK